MNFEIDDERLRKALGNFQMTDRVRATLDKIQGLYPPVTPAIQSQIEAISRGFNPIEAAMMLPGVLESMTPEGQAEEARRVMRECMPPVSEAERARFEESRNHVICNPMLFDPPRNPIFDQIAGMFHDAAGALDKPDEAEQIADLKTEIQALKAQVAAHEKELHPEPPPKDDRSDKYTGQYL